MKFVFIEITNLLTIKIFLATLAKQMITLFSINRMASKKTLLILSSNLKRDMSLDLLKIIKNY